MFPLVSYQRILTCFCIIPDETSPKWQKLTHLLIAASMVFAIISALIPSVAFFVKFVSIDLEVSLYALFQLLGLLNVFYVMTAVYLSRRKFTAFFKSLSIIHETRKNVFRQIVFTYSPLKIISNKF